MELNKIKFKEVRDTFPAENRRVFALVEKAISEASVQEIRRTPEGAAAYDSQDALTFLALAMKLHDNLQHCLPERSDAG